MEGERKIRGIGRWELVDARGGGRWRRELVGGEGSWWGERGVGRCRGQLVGLGGI